MDIKNQPLVVNQLLGALKSVLGDGPVSLHEPIFIGNEMFYLKECVDSTFVSSVGKYVDRFEAELAAYTGAKYVVAVMNGTAALHIALKLADVQSGNEVLVPALTFAATSNAVAYCNATPHFIDSDEETLGMDAIKLRNYLAENTEQYNGNCINIKTGKVIKAMIPMHTFGHPVNLDGLLAVGRDFNIEIVEDAAESLGSLYCGKHTGTFGKIGTISFNGNKIITTGGGGAILTNDERLARYAKHLTTTAKLPHAWEYRHDQIGYNYRLPNLNAALGCAQLERLPAMLSEKRILYQRYKQAFQGIQGVTLFSEPNNCKSNYWLQTILLDAHFTKYRDNILKATNDAGFMTRPAWVLMNELIPFRGCPSMNMDVAQLLSKRIINIPSSSGLA